MPAVQPTPQARHARGRGDLAMGLYACSLCPLAGLADEIQTDRLSSARLDAATRRVLSRVSDRH